MSKILHHQDLILHKKAFAAAMEIFELSRSFPRAEVYSLTDQIRRSSRSVCANTAEAWRKRRYSAAFVAKLNDAEAEAAETQTWLEFSAACGYTDANVVQSLLTEYNEIIALIVSMINDPDKWVLPSGRR